MLENIRKYSALMIIVLVLLAFGLVVTLGNGNSSSSKSDVVTVNGDGYSEKVLTTQFDSLSSLGRISPIFSQYLAQLTNSAFHSDIDPRFMPLINQLLVNQEAKKLGLFVSTADAEKFITEFVFPGENEQRDYSTYNKFVEKDLKQIGMKEADFKKVVVNLLTFHKVSSIKSQLNLPASLSLIGKETETDIYAMMRHGGITDFQTIDSAIVQFDIKNYTEKVSPTEEQLKEFYENNKNAEPYATALRTPKLLKLSYIAINLEGIETATEKTDEATKALLEVKKERQADTFNNYKKFARDDDNFGENPDLEALASKHKLQLQSTELVAAKDLEQYFADLQIIDEKTRVNNSLYGYLYSGNIKKVDKIQVKVPNAAKDGTSYLHYRIDEKVEAKLKPFEQCKEQLMEFTTKKLALELMLEDAKKVRTTLIKGIAEKQNSFEALAKQQEVTVINEPKLSLTSANKDIKLSSEAYTNSAKVNPGKFSEVFSDDSNNAAFVYVKKRELLKPDDFKTQDAEYIRSRSGQLAGLAFFEWLTAEFQKAKDSDNLSYVGQDK